jgi:hypothetical protein
MPTALELSVPQDAVTINAMAPMQRISVECVSRIAALYQLGSKAEM